jgi:hypothetical protein
MRVDDALFGRFLRSALLACNMYSDDLENTCIKETQEGMDGFFNDNGDFGDSGMPIRPPSRGGRVIAETLLASSVPKKIAELRKQMHEWARDSDEGRKSKHGGFYTTNGEWIPLEDSLLLAYGGAQEIMAFTNMYNVTVHVHAPETVADANVSRQYC